MKIHAYLLCYNEESIIKHILEYYSSICTKIFVLDNYSSDKSIEIAKTFDKVKIIQFSTGGEFRADVGTETKLQTFKDYSRGGGKYTTEVADWIVAADMDEVLYHPNLLEILKDFKTRNITVPTTVGFNMIGPELLHDKPIIEQYKFGMRSFSFDKPLIWDVNFDMILSPGCHPNTNAFAEMLRHENYKTCDENKLSVLHYKYVGDRWHEVANRAIPRRKSQWKFDADGHPRGPGHHYYIHANADKEEYQLRINRQKTRVLDDQLNVLFKKFETPDIYDAMQRYRMVWTKKQPYEE